jgi:hypothetical protein
MDADSCHSTCRSGLVGLAESGSQCLAIEAGTSSQRSEAAAPASTGRAMPAGGRRRSHMEEHAFSGAQGCAGTLATPCHQQARPCCRQRTDAWLLPIGPEHMLGATTKQRS